MPCQHPGLLVGCPEILCKQIQRKVHHAFQHLQHKPKMPRRQSCATAERHAVQAMQHLSLQHEP